MQYDSLIYGKNNIERVVAVEALEGNLLLFIQEQDGRITTKSVPNRYWILSNLPYDQSWKRLEGNLYYKYGKQFVSKEEYMQTRNFLKNKDLYFIANDIEAGLVNTGVTYFKGMRHDEPSILSFDIETTGLKHNESSKIILISNTFRNHKGQITRKLFCYDEFEDEGEMLVAWCDWVRKIDPSIMTGHNISSYDLGYISFIARKYDVELNLGRDGSPIHFNNYESKFRKDATQFYHYKKAKIFGREIIDTLFLSIKYDINRQYVSYALKQIIKQEGLEVKDRQFYDAVTIKDNYTNPIEMKKIKAYAMFDADDSLALYDLMSPSFFYMTQSVPKAFQLLNESATGSQLNSVLVRSYLQNRHSIPKATELTYHVEGGISFAVPAIYNNVFKIDLKSAYPSQVLRFKLFDEKKDPKAHFYKMVEHFTLKRFEYKKLHKETGDNYYLNLDQSSKIFINSAYGMCNTPGLNFNSPSVAAKITRETRKVLADAIFWASGKKVEYWQELFEIKTGKKEDTDVAV